MKDKTIHSISPSLGRDMNPGPREYYAGVMHTRSRYSVGVWSKSNILTRGGHQAEIIPRDLLGMNPPHILWVSPPSSGALSFLIDTVLTETNHEVPLYGSLLSCRLTSSWHVLLLYGNLWNSRLSVFLLISLARELEMNIWNMRTQRH